VLWMTIADNDLSMVDICDGSSDTDRWPARGISHATMDLEDGTVHGRGI
jgi:hypothetical protein